MGPIMLRGQFLDELVGRVVQLLPDDVSHDTVFESLRYLSGQQLTDNTSLVAAWRIAGNVQRLRSDVPAPPWATQAEREWTPVEFIAGKPYRNQYNKLGTLFSFRVMAGSPCPMKIQAFWSDALCRAMARRIGFSAPWYSYPYRHPMEFVRLRCVVLIEPRLSRVEPQFRDLLETQPSSIVTHNRKILKVRKHIQRCPHGWTHSCHKCVVGYQQCVGGVHRLDYVKRACLVCGQEDYFDDDLATDRCINCQHRFLRKRTQQS
jgi:hypothetical protein